MIASKRLERLAAAILAMALLSDGSLRSESYRLDLVAQGSGAVSSGGIYMLSSTFGQPLTGLATGEEFELAGGFWPTTLVVPGEAVPTISIARVGGQVVISWPATATDFVLQKTDALTPAQWVTLVENTNSITLSASEMGGFFRLIRE